MESIYHIVTVRVNETSWAHIWRLRSRYLGTGYDKEANEYIFATVVQRVENFVVRGRCI
jgi:hypothetical protein